MTALLGGMVRRNFVEMRRYGFETLFQVIGFAGMFLLLFYGAKGIGGQEIRSGDALPALVAGYIVFALVVIAYSGLASWVTQEALLGTLEQIAMSPFSMLRVLVAEFVTALLAEFVLVALLLGVAMAATGQWLHFDIVTLAPLVACVLVGVLGVGLVMAGAALMFKRVNSLIMILQFGFLSLIAVPVSQYEWLRFAPIALPNALIRRSTVNGDTLAEMPGGDLLLSAVVAIVYLVLGAAVFAAAERAARRRGVIGQH